MKYKSVTGMSDVCLHFESPMNCICYPANAFSSEKFVCFHKRAVWLESILFATQIH